MLNVISDGFNMDEIKQIFLGDKFKDVTKSVKKKWTNDIKLYKKYLHRSYFALFYHGKKFKPKKIKPEKLILNAEKIIENQTSGSLLLKYKEKCLELVSKKSVYIPNFKLERLSELEQRHIKNLIEKGQRLKGIRKNERNELNELKKKYPVEAFKHKWITDIEYAVNTDKFLPPKIKDGTVYPMMIHENEELLVFGCTAKELFNITNYEPLALRDPNHSKEAKELSRIVTRGDDIRKIIVCKDGILAEKITNICWFVRN